jgi:hypothetical protein
MKNSKLIFLFLAVLATFSIMSIGISISLNSLLGIVFAIIMLIIIMGIGFTLKKKLREQGEL